ncbi:metallophosphoesterase [Halanaerobacter jeridensis]|uniref:DNA repair exonuclease SbcCD nuclease subunit n=1 Tax=Halanaerobacter jeridensis TaxID=706427 RepID=A0A939BRI1_9FIRM|nr:metallophosphoesterase [Halanaerobacter jeridensis]MBM7556026.1 DNA repair exonuclease SbcCD nuclease subunit [Halanaerobacter jeridensis]
MKLLVVNDTHIRGTTPSRRVDNFKETLLDKLKEVQQIAEKEEADMVLHSGDLFDRPDTAPSIVSEFVKLLRDFSMPIYIVAGNHDLYGHNPETLPRTMLGLLVASGIVNLIGENGIIREKDNIKLQLTGRSFDYTLDNKNTTAYEVEKREDVDYALHLVHGMLLDKPVFEDGYTLIEDIETEADITITGHYHLGYGIKEFNNSYFLNPGSIVRISADLKEIARMPQVALIDLKDEINIELMTLDSAQQGEEVLDRSELEKQKFREKKLADFNQQISAAGEFKHFKIDDILDEVANNQNISQDVKEEALSRISQAQERLGGQNQ